MTKNDDFLKEVQKKINKRSGGYYYNTRLKNLKRNLYVTSIALIILLALFFIIRVISMDSIEKISKETNVKVQKEGIRYVIELRNHDILKEYFKKYTVISKDDTLVYLVPPKDKKYMIELILDKKIGLKEENYIKNGFFFQFVFK